MARPLRIEFAGALYHVTSRGNAQQDIYLDDEDRELFMLVLGECCELFNWSVHSWCQMTNHYHLLIETPDANLSKGMRYLNGVYTHKDLTPFLRLTPFFRFFYLSSIGVIIH